MVRSIDRNVGRVMDKLRELGLAENTLTVFLNDNGGGGNNASEHTRNTARNVPHRGHKFDVWEGGLRVPFILHWPAQVPAGKASTASSAAWMSSRPSPAPPPPSCPPIFDGVNLLPFAEGRRNRQPPRRPTSATASLDRADPTNANPGPGYPQPAYNLAVRCGTWKAIKLDQTFDGTNEPRAWELYDLSCDPAELNDLATPSSPSK